MHICLHLVSRGYRDRRSARVFDVLELRGSVIIANDGAFVGCKGPNLKFGRSTVWKAL